MLNGQKPGVRLVARGGVRLTTDPSVASAITATDCAGTVIKTGPVVFPR
jgi:hypothetical protein